MKKKKPVLTPLARKWIKALRSSRYRQCVGVLQNSSGANCCLGVACRVAGLRWTESGFEDESGNLPPSVKTSLRLRDAYGNPLGGLPALVDLNDRHRLSFKKIATHLEKNAAEYFVQPGEFANDPSEIPQHAGHRRQDWCSMRQKTVKIDWRQLAETRGLLLREMTAGRVRWEPFVRGGKQGELFFNGIRHSTELDEAGCPIMDQRLRDRITSVCGRIGAA